LLGSFAWLLDGFARWFRSVAGLRDRHVCLLDTCRSGRGDVLGGRFCLLIVR
jgi:hypothetical protein